MKIQKKIKRKEKKKKKKKKIHRFIKKVSNNYINIYKYLKNKELK
jgi:hypothetical protein